MTDWTVPNQESALPLGGQWHLALPDGSWGNPEPGGAPSDPGPTAPAFGPGFSLAQTSAAEAASDFLCLRSERPSRLLGIFWEEAKTEKEVLGWGS